MKSNILFSLFLLLAICGCKHKNEHANVADGDSLNIVNDINQSTAKSDESTIKLKSDILSAEVLWMFGRVYDVQVSPDGKSLLYTVKKYNLAENKGNADLYTMSVDGKEKEKISDTPLSEQQARWRPDGKKIAFLSTESGSSQLWECDPDGTNRTQVSKIDGGINGFAYSPDVKKVVYFKDVRFDKTVNEIYKDLPKANARLIDDMMYRHWDAWVDGYSHLFLADYDGSKLTGDIDIMKDEKWESPVRPHGGVEQIAWSPDSKSLVYVCRKKVGKDYAISTNTDLYQYDLSSKGTKNLTEGMMGYDMNPVFSPDGSKLAWESMARDGYESDKVRLFVLDLASGDKRDYTKDFDNNAKNIVWSADGKSAYFISNIKGTDEIMRLDLSEAKIARVTDGVHDYNSVVVAGSKLIAVMHSMSKPDEVYNVDPSTGVETELSFVNKDLLSQLKFGSVEKRIVKTTDKKDMLAWVIYPPNFDKTKKYPTLLYCQGGPQSTVSQFWSYRWNFQLMAAHGYIVIAPNRRGVPGFGQAWNEQISGDYGGQNMKDYLSAIDDIAKEPFVDAKHLGAVGASYGGYSVYWLAGNHNKRFKAFIAHCGIFNLEAQYAETEEIWFANWDFGGAPWDKTNKTAQKTYASSPHKFVQNWDTPILIMQGAKDYRIPETQGMAAFNAAKLKGVPAEMLYFPEETHWVVQPQNSVLWNRVFFNWLDKYLKVQ